MNYKTILKSYANAVYNKDLENFISIYDNKVHVYDTWKAWSYKNRDEYKNMVREWFDSLGDEKVRVEFNEINVLQTQDQTVWIGEIKFYGLSENDEILRSISNRWTWVIQNKNQVLKIVHEHSSLPIDIETFSGIMKTR